MLNTKLEDPRFGFIVAGLECAKFSFYQFTLCLFIVHIVISFLLKTTLLQIEIQHQLLVKILQRSDKEDNTFETIGKYRYGL